MKTIIINGIYSHYKGGNVAVIAIAKHSETLEEMVIYECLYDCKTGGIGSVFARPLSMFADNVNILGIETERFKFVRMNEKAKIYTQEEYENACDAAGFRD